MQVLLLKETFDKVQASINATPGASLSRADMEISLQEQKERLASLQ
jgi:hypothetical protein